MTDTSHDPTAASGEDLAWAHVEISTAALQYARLGLRVHPLDRASKRPLLTDWPSEATTDEDVVSALFSGGDRNVGIVTGGWLVVIDVDPRSGGGESMARLEAELGTLPLTWVCATGGGGEHRYYSVAAVDGQRLRHHLPGYRGVDVQHEGRQVVAPPSIHPSGARYAWAPGLGPADRDIAELPVAWAARLIETDPPPRPSAPRPNAPPNDRIRDKALRWLARQDAAIEGLGGSTVVMRIMASLRRMGVASADDAIDLLEASGWNARCEPPWDLGGPQGLRRKYDESDAPIGGGGDEPPWPTERRGPSVEDLMNEAREAGEEAGRLRVESVTTPTASEDWPPLDPFEEARRPAFPVDVFPAWLSTWVVDTATSLQVPEDLTAVLGLAVVSTAALSFDVDIRASWTDEVTAAYFALPLHSGERKTPAASRATRPILDWERVRAEAMAPEIIEAQREFAAAKKREKNLIDELAKGGPDALDIKRELSLLRLPEIPRPPCMLVHDVTPERLAVSLKENGERKAIISTEGELVSVLLGKYQDARHPANIDVILKAHDGEPLRVERIGRDPVHLERPKMTICMTTQPALVARLMGSDDLGDRGLLPRFWYAYPASMLGSRDVRAPPVPMHVDADYATGIKRILDADSGEPRRVKFSPEAQEMVIAFDAENEPQLAPDTKRPVMRAWLAKFVGKTCRLAALLAIADAAGRNGGLAEDPVVDGQTFGRAARLASYFRAHAEVLFGEAGIEPVARVAASVQRWAARRGEPFSEKEALRANAGGTRTMDELRPALAELVRRGYIRRASATDRAGKAGRLPSPVYDLRPIDGGDSSV